MLFIVNPVIMSVLGYLNIIAYFGCVGVIQPFRAYCTYILYGERAERCK